MAIPSGPYPFSGSNFQHGRLTTVNPGGGGKLWLSVADEIQQKLAQQENAANREASLVPHQLAQQRFNTILPYLTGQMGASASVGGQSGPSPEITVAPVYNSQDIQQQVNAARAQNDQATGSRIRSSQQQLAGRGFGANSPIQAALAGMYQNQNLATNTANEREVRMGSRQMNAQQVLRAQQAREGQFASRMQEDIERRRTAQAHQNQIIAALAGLV